MHRGATLIAGLGLAGCQLLSGGSDLTVSAKPGAEGGGQIGGNGGGATGGEAGATTGGAGGGDFPVPCADLALPENVDLISSGVAGQVEEVLGVAATPDGGSISVVNVQGEIDFGVDNYSEPAAKGFILKRDDGGTIVGVWDPKPSGRRIVDVAFNESEVIVGGRTVLGCGYVTRLNMTSG